MSESSGGLNQSDKSFYFHLLSIDWKLRNAARLGVHRQTGTLGFKASQAGYIVDLIVTVNPAITRQRQSDRRGEELIDEGREVFSRLMQRS
jgi:hypothetical protein